MVCKDHEGTAISVTISREVVKLEREVRSLMVAETEEERIRAAKRFQQRVKRGEFASLFTERFRELLVAGAAEPLDLELGALRLAIFRLMMEEQDPTKMATALSKVANSAAQVKKTQVHLSTLRDETDAEIEALRNQFLQWSRWRESMMDDRQVSLDQEQESLNVARRELTKAEDRVEELEARAAGAERRAAQAEWNIREAQDRMKKLKELEQKFLEETGRQNIARGWG